MDITSYSDYPAEMPATDLDSRTGSGQQDRLHLSATVARRFRLLSLARLLRPARQVGGPTDTTGIGPSQTA